MRLADELDDGKYDLYVDHAGDVGRTRRKKSEKNPKTSSWYVLGTVGQIGYSVALPLVIGALVGSYIDRKIGSYPRGTLLGLGSGFVLSVISFYHVIRDIIRESRF